MKPQLEHSRARSEAVSIPSGRTRTLFRLYGGIVSLVASSAPRHDPADDQKDSSEDKSDRDPRSKDDEVHGLRKSRLLQHGKIHDIGNYPEHHPCDDQKKKGDGYLVHSLYGGPFVQASNLWSRIWAQEKLKEWGFTGMALQGS